MELETQGQIENRALRKHVRNDRLRRSVRSQLRPRLSYLPSDDARWELPLGEMLSSFEIEPEDWVAGQVYARRYAWAAFAQGAGLPRPIFDGWPSRPACRAMVVDKLAFHVDRFREIDQAALGASRTARGELLSVAVLCELERSPGRVRAALEAVRASLGDGPLLAEFWRAEKDDGQARAWSDLESVAGYLAQSLARLSQGSVSEFESEKVAA